MESENFEELSSHDPPTRVSKDFSFTSCEDRKGFGEMITLMIHIALRMKCSFIECSTTIRVTESNLSSVASWALSFLKSVSSILHQNIRCCKGLMENCGS